LVVVKLSVGWLWLSDVDSVCLDGWLLVRLSIWMARPVVRLSVRMTDWW